MKKANKSKLIKQLAKDIADIDELKKSKGRMYAGGLKPLTEGERQAFHDGQLRALSYVIQLLIEKE